MTEKRTSHEKLIQALRNFALQQPGAEEGVACAGTSLEKRTIKARKKAFLFLGISDLMLKLDEAVPQAEKLAAKAPTCCKVGLRGWVSVKFGKGAPPERVLLKWVAESYRVMSVQGTTKQLSKKSKMPST
jgi:hypothetical protein